MSASKWKARLEASPWGWILDPVIRRDAFWYAMIVSFSVLGIFLLPERMIGCYQSNWSCWEP